LLDRSPAVISFYRGGWYPYCNTELCELQRVPSHIESLASLLAILPCKVLTTVHGNKLTFPVSSGVRNVVAKRFGIVFQLREELLALGINPERYQETSRCL
jgi:peroxiredoxin